MDKDFDTVVIGAGNAGLTAAVTLQRGGLKTLLLERHNIPGGSATSFVRGSFEFEVALHQLCGLGTQEKPFVLRRLFNELGVMDKVEFVEEPELYRFVIPGKVNITLPAGIKALEETLSKAFPNEADAIKSYLNLCRAICYENFVALPRLRKNNDGKALEKDCPNYIQYGLRSCKEVMDEFFNDEFLKAALGVYWSYLGIPLSNLPFADLGGMFYLYAEHRPFYIKDGSQAMSNALLEVFIETGGEIRFNCAADKILTDNGAVVAVRTEHGDVFSCSHIVSNSSSIHTFNELLDISEPLEVIQDDFKSRRIGVSAFVVYMGLDCRPQDLGVQAATNFITTTTDTSAVFEGARSLEASRFCLLTCYNPDEGAACPDGKSMVSLVDIQYGEIWDNIAPKDYAANKYAYADKLIDLAETTFPNLRQHIQELEVATPVTMMRYLNTPGGAIYGFDQNFLESTALRNRLDVAEGLYLAGSWTGLAGFQSTYMAGAGAAKTIIKHHKRSLERNMTHG